MFERKTTRLNYWTRTTLAAVCGVAAVALLGSPAIAQENGARGTAAARYPRDVDPESGFRLPLPKRENLDEAGKKVWDSVATPGERSIAGLRGPRGIRLYSPKVAELSDALGQHLRYDAGIPPELRELTILSTARELNAQFEWSAHEPVALKAGLSQNTIDVVKHRYSAIGLPEKQEVIIQLSREIFRTRRVQPDTFARARKAFGERDLVNIVSLMGAYSSTAILLETFDMQLPAGQTPPLPLP